LIPEPSPPHFSQIAYFSACFRYPYEAIHVITSDGYVLLLERIPRYIDFSPLIKW
jgi:hypothetical protein